MRNFFKSLLEFLIGENTKPLVYALIYLLIIYFCNLHFISVSFKSDVNYYYILLGYLSFSLGLSGFGLSSFLIYEAQNLNIKTLFLLMRFQLLVLFLLLPVILIFIPIADASYIRIFLICFFLFSQRLNDLGQQYFIQMNENEEIYKNFYFFKGLIFLMTYILSIYHIKLHAIDSMLISYIISNLFIFFKVFKFQFFNFFEKFKFKDLLRFKKINLIYSFLASYIEVILSSSLIFISNVFHNQELLYIYIVTLRLLSPLVNLNAFLTAKYTKKIINKSFYFREFNFENLFFSLSFILIVFLYLLLTDFHILNGLVSKPIFIYFFIFIAISHFLNSIASWLVIYILSNKKFQDDFFIKILTIACFFIILFLIYITQSFILLPFLLFLIPLLRIFYYFFYLSKKQI